VYRDCSATRFELLDGARLLPVVEGILAASARFYVVLTVFCCLSMREF
jgi:hypothetical protein